jgi:hypothetical protein
MEEESANPLDSTSRPKILTPSDLPDPRTPGTTSPYETEEMTVLKRLVLLSLLKGVQLAVAVRCVCVCVCERACVCVRE